MKKTYTLKELRMMRDETQETVSRGIGINRALYSHYENGIRTPNVHVAKNIARYFGVKVDDIIFLSLMIQTATKQKQRRR